MGSILDHKDFWKLKLLLNKGEESWGELLKLLYSWPEDSDRALAVRYAYPYVQDWSPDSRWILGMQTNNPCWPLFATLRCLNHDIAALPELVNHPHISVLDLHGCTQLCRLQQLAPLIHIQSLILSGCQLVFSGEELFPKLSKLQSLHLDHCENLRNLKPLKNLSQLKSLSLRHCSQLTSLKGIKKLPLLEILDLDYCASLSDIQTITNLQRLQTLRLSFCISLQKLSPLESLSSLSYLDLDGCTAIMDEPEDIELRFNHLETIQLRWWKNEPWDQDS